MSSEELVMYCLLSNDGIGLQSSISACSDVLLPFLSGTDPMDMKVVDHLNFKIYSYMSGRVGNGALYQL